MDRGAGATAQCGAGRARTFAGSGAHVLHGNRAEAAVLELPGASLTAVLSHAKHRHQIGSDQAVLRLELVLPLTLLRLLVFSCEDEGMAILTQCARLARCTARTPSTTSRRSPTPTL